MMRKAGLEKNPLYLCPMSEPSRTPEEHLSGSNEVDRPSAAIPSDPQRQRDWLKHVATQDREHRERESAGYREREAQHRLAHPDGMPFHELPPEELVKRTHQDSKSSDDDGRSGRSGPSFHGIDR
jgi:hypothetical protein